MLTLILQRSSYLFLQSAKIKGVLYHFWCAQYFKQATIWLVQNLFPSLVVNGEKVLNPRECWREFNRQAENSAQ